MVGISLYIVLTSLQILGIFYISYSTFRYKLSSYWRESLFASVTVAGILYFIRVLELKAFLPLVVCSILTLFLWVIIRIPIIYSALMVVTGYLALIIIETIVVYILYNFHILSFFKVDTLSDSSIISSANVVMIATNLMLFALSWWLYRRGYGFAFSFTRKVKIKNEISVLLIVILLSIIVISMIYYSVIHSHINLFIAAVVNAISLSALLFVSLKREYGDNG